MIMKHNSFSFKELKTILNIKTFYHLDELETYDTFVITKAYCDILDEEHTLYFPITILEEDDGGGWYPKSSDTRQNINYYIKELNGKSDAKGALNEFMYLKDLSKGYSMPVVARAVVNYFVDNIPVLETLYNSKNILDFCLTQNVGKQFHVEYVEGTNIIPMQRYVRFYASNQGGFIYKVHNDSFAKNGLCAGQKVQILNSLDDKQIEFRNINYNYYYKEALKIIDPIKLRISPNMKGDKNKGTKSGKALLKQMSGQYQSLFDDEDFD